MAFKILSEKDLELLTDSQREQYNEALEIHREREKFVEQLEKMENIRIEPYQPSLAPIPAIRKAPEKHFVKKEHEVRGVNAFPRPVAKVRQVKAAPVAAPVVPKIEKAAAVRVKPVRKEEVTADAVPVHEAVRIPRMDITMPEPVQPQLHAAAKIRVPTAKSVEKMPVQVRVEAGLKPKFKNFETFTFDRIKAKPWAVSAAPVSVRVPAAPVNASTQPKLPHAAVSFPAAKQYHIPAAEAVKLPETAPVRCSAATYTKPEIAPVPAVCISVPVIPQRSHKAVSPVRPQIPAAVRSVVKAPDYSAPEIRAAVDTGHTQPVRVPGRTFTPFTGTTPEVAVPTPVHAPKKVFKKVEDNIKPLPETVSVTLPDPHSNEVIRALLSRAKK